MNKFIIMTDSTTDLPREFFAENDIKHQPHGFVIDGHEYPDIFWTAMSQEAFYATIKSGKPVSTAQPSLEVMYRDVEAAFAAGQDALYVCFSSKLSGTYGTTRMVAQEMQEKYPGRVLETVDTCCASLGQGMLVKRAAEMRAEGASLEQVVSTLEAEKSHIYHMFTVDDLHHLRRGGRLSGTAAVMGTLVGIKPILHMSKEGVLLPIAKIRGRHNVLEELVRMAVEKVDDTTISPYVVHVDCLGEATEVANMLKEKTGLPVTIQLLGPAISSHVGIGTIGIILKSNK